MQDAEQHPLTRAINILVNAMHPPTVGKNGESIEISFSKLYEDIRSATGGEGLSRSTLWKLRRGETLNPSVETLEALRRYFGLDSLEPLRDPELATVYARELRVLNALKGQQDAPTLELLLRGGLEDGSVRHSDIAVMLEVAQRIVAEQPGRNGEEQS